MNRLDLDSDGDGCFDAIEGGANFTISAIDENGRLLGKVDANGVPTVATVTGQSVGSSINLSQQDAACSSLMVLPESGLVSTSGGVSIVNVRANDKVNGQIATISNSVLSQVGTWPTGITLNTSGAITVANATPPGVYLVPYRLCDLTNPTPNCIVATDTVRILSVLSACPCTNVISSSLLTTEGNWSYYGSLCTGEVLFLSLIHI